MPRLWLPRWLCLPLVALALVGVKSVRSAPPAAERTRARRHLLRDVQGSAAVSGAYARLVVREGREGRWAGAEAALAERVALLPVVERVPLEPILKRRHETLAAVLDSARARGSQRTGDSLVAPWQSSLDAGAAPFESALRDAVERAARTEVALEWEAWLGGSLAAGAGLLAGLTLRRRRRSAA